MLQPLLPTVALVVLADVRPVRAADEITISRAGGANPSQPAITLERSRLELNLGVDNTADRLRDVTIVATKLREQEGKADATTAWKIVKSPATIELTEDAPTAVRFEPKTNYSVTLVASIPSAGVYQAELKVSENNVAVSRYIIQVNRVVPALDSGSLAITRGTYVRELVAPLAIFTSPLKLSAVVQNTTNKNLDIQSVAIETNAVLERIGAQENLVRTDVVANLQTCQAAVEIIPLRPSATCHINVTLSNLASAGEYTIKLFATGAGGGRLDLPLTLKTRFSWVYPAFAIALGTLLGYFVRQWRTRDRGTALALYDLATLIQWLEGVPPQDGGTGTVIAVTLARAKDLQARLYNGLEAQTAGVDSLKTRVGAIRQWINLEQVYSSVHEAERPAVLQRRAAVLNLLQDIDSDPVTLTRGMSDYRTQLSDARDRSFIRIQLDDLNSKYGAVLDAAAKLPAVAEAAAKAKAALKKVEDELAKTTFDPTAAQTAIVSALEAIKACLAIKAAQPGAVIEEATAEKVDLITPGLAPLLPFAMDSAPATILRRIMAADTLANMIGGLIIVLIGIQVLWSGNLTWGSFSDWIAALFAGAGLQFGYGSAISELKTQLRPA